MATVNLGAMLLKEIAKGLKCGACGGDPTNFEIDSLVDDDAFRIRVWCHGEECSSFVSRLAIEMTRGNASQIVGILGLVLREAAQFWCAHEECMGGTDAFPFLVPGMREECRKRRMKVLRSKVDP